MKFQTVLDNEVDAFNTLAYIVELFKPSGKRELVPDGTPLGLCNATDLRLYNLEIQSGCIVENGQYKIIFETDRELVLLAAAHVFWDTIPSEIKMKAGCRVDMYQPQLMSDAFRKWGLKRFQTDFKGDELNTLPVGLILGRNPVLKPALMELEKEFITSNRSFDAVATMEYIRCLMGIKKLMPFKALRDCSDGDSYKALISYYRWHTRTDSTYNDTLNIVTDNHGVKITFPTRQDFTLSLTASVSGNKMIVNFCLPVDQVNKFAYIDWDNHRSKPLNLDDLPPEMDDDYRTWANRNFTGLQS